MSTDLLGLKELVDGQVDPYATVNEALRQIEGRTIRVLSRTTDAQPGSPSAGDTYIITGSATGAAWGGFSEHDIAHYYGGSWKAYTPIEGLRLWVNDEDTLVRFDGSAWAELIIAPRFSTSGKTANFSVTTTDRGVVFLVDATSGAVTMSLPGASAAGDGFLVGVKKIDGSANDVVVSRDGSDTIEGATSLTLSDQWAGTLLAGDGTDEWVQLGGGSGGGGGGGSSSYDFGMTFGAEPSASTVIQRVQISRAITIPADMTGSTGSVNTNPGSAYDIDVRDDGTSIGTISIATDGTFTFTTTSNEAKSVAAGSLITFVTPGSADGTIDGVAVGILATEDS